MIRFISESGDEIEGIASVEKDDRGRLVTFTRHSAPGDGGESEILAAIEIDGERFGYSREDLWPGDTLRVMLP